jgi:hypothetical protein
MPVLMFSFENLSAQDRNLLQKAISPDQLEGLLIKDQKWVTYPDYTDREGWDKLTGSLKQVLIVAGEKRLDYQWQTVPLSAYLEYERSGNRSLVDSPYNENTYALNILVLAELAEGKGRFMDQIINGVWYFCDMSSWANPNGLLATSATRPSRPFPNPNEQVIDLVTGDMGSLLAWTYHFLKAPMDQVHAGISARLRNQLQERILDPYMNRDNFWWQALNPEKKFVNNWNSWCNSNVLTCYLLLENDPQKLTAAVSRTMKSVDQYINYNHDDGGCEEGPSYWSHGPGKLYDYLTLLNRASGGKISIFAHPIIKNLGEYIVRSYIGDGWVVNFADASAKGNSAPGMIYRYGKAVNSASMQQFGAYLARRGQDYRYVSNTGEFFRILENLTTGEELDKVPTALPSTLSAWYPQTELCFLRKDDFFMAAKGGYNNESHNHNDIGSFVLFYKNKPVFVDLGVGTYTSQTFSKDRYKIWSMQSDYHNVPKINGVSQKYGAQYRAKDTRFDSTSMTFSLDIAAAYDSASRQRWVRSIGLPGSGRGLVIQDGFTLSDVRIPNQLHFMCAHQPDVSRPGVVSFSIDGEQLQLKYDPKVLWSNRNPLS